MIAVGIDVAEARKGLDLVALDDDLNIVKAMSHASVSAVFTAIDDLHPDVVCIDSPPGWSVSGRSRQAERDLAQLGISAFSTPTDPAEHGFYQWMRVGFSLFDGIRDTHPRYGSGSVRGTAVEVFPEASAVVLAGRLRPSNESKRVFRGGVLQRVGIEIGALRSVDAIDAALAAYTGWFALREPFATVGDPAEGVIVLPVAALPAHRLLRPSDGPGMAARESRPAARGSMRSSAMSECLCGCGASVRRRFLPGHDAKLKSRLRQEATHGDASAALRLEELGW